MAVCARREVCGLPQVGARDQYIPDDGAGGTSGAVRGSQRGGKGMWGCRRRWCWEWEVIRAVVVVLVVLARMEGWGMVGAPGLEAMAEVERRAVGRWLLRPGAPLELPAEESCLSRRCWEEEEAETSLLSLFLVAGEVSLGVVGCDGPPPGPGVLLSCGTAKDGWLADGLVTATEDCDRCRMDSSDGLRRRSWLLDERWPGVWLRGI